MQQLYEEGKTKLDMVHSCTIRTLALLIPLNRSSEIDVSPGFCFLVLLFRLGQNHCDFLALSLLGK